MNGAGFYDRERSKDKRAGTFRIAYLGSSYAEGVQVQLPNTVGAVLERRLTQFLAARYRNVEVLNFGVAGYTLTESYLQLQTQVWPYHPDLILLGIDSSSGVIDNNRATSVVGDQTPYYIVNNGRLESDKDTHPAAQFNARSARVRDLVADVCNRVQTLSLINYVRSLLRDQWRDLRQKQEPTALPQDFSTTFPFRPPETPEMQDAWRVNDALLLAFRDEVRRHGVPLWLVIQDTPQQATSVLEERERFKKRVGVSSLFYSNDRIAAFAREHGIAYIPLGHEMADYSAATHIPLHGTRNGVPQGGHWNEAGNAMAGKFIADELGPAILKDSQVH